MLEWDLDAKDCAFSCFAVEADLAVCVAEVTCDECEICSGRATFCCYGPGVGVVCGKEPVVIILGGFEFLECVLEYRVNTYCFRLLGKRGRGEVHRVLHPISQARYLG